MAPKAPPRCKKSASPPRKRLTSLLRLPSDTEEGAQNLIASCEKYLDENESRLEEDHSLIINPFLDVKMSQPQVFDPHSQHRKLSSVSDIRDNIKETYEEADSGFHSKTVPRIYSHSKHSSQPEIRFKVFDSKPFYDSYKRQDGTESVRSFVIVSKPKSQESSTLDLTDEEDNEMEDEWSQDEDIQSATGSFKAASNNKGFVNKCVTRVKSLVHPKN